LIVSGSLRSGWWPAWLLLVPALVLARVLPPSLPQVDDDYWSARYDGHFRKYAKHYFGPGVDWRWFKAQAIVESRLKPKAHGPSGAVGLMQILPATFSEIRRENPHFRRINDPRWNIAAGIYYDRQLQREWLDVVKPAEALNFAFASYNAGPGRVRRAYKRAVKRGKQVLGWRQVAPHAPPLTRRYVRRIHKLMGKQLG